MKRIDRIRNMTTDEMAREIVKLNFTDEYCKSTCEDAWGADEVICQDELGCCIRWLEGEV